MATAAKGRTRGRQAAKMIKQNNMAMLIILAIMLVLVAALFFQGNKMEKKIVANRAKIQELGVQITEETQRTQDIQELEQYMQSPEYIEKVAKDKLGLIKDGETIFKEQK
ncbi:MAG: septum formation initiator family protein [Lachnospiraceae bacterium]|nr:septum formation initiator family protein [Lachnospiraceae bacterium]